LQYLPWTLHNSFHVALKVSNMRVLPWIWGGMFCPLSPACNTEDESSTFHFDVWFHLLEDQSMQIGKMQFRAE
jgi:hypothetical protein